MFDLSILVATTNQRDQSVMESLNTISLSDTFKQHVCGTAKTSGEAYRKARELAPDLIIIEERLYTASLNLLCENCDVIVITDAKGKSDCGNVRYCYKPIQIAFLAKKMAKMYASMDDTQLEEIRSFRRSDMEQFPKDFPEKDEQRLHHPEMTPIMERRTNKATIRDGSFTFTPAEHREAPAADIRFYSKNVLAMMDEQQEGDQNPVDENKNDVMNVVWVTKPRKILYLPGEKITGEGGKVGIAYRSGVSEEVPVEEENLPTDPIAKIGMTEAVFHFRGVELALPISVGGNQLVSLIVINPCRTEYMEGEHPDTTHMILYGKRADNTVEPITGFSYDDRPLTSRDNQIVFRAENREIAIPIHVKENTILSAELQSPPKLMYQFGEELDLSEGLVKIQYADGKTAQKPLDAADLAVPFDAHKEGKQVLLFKAGLGAIPVTVEVAPEKKEKIPTAIMIYARPKRVSYPLGFQELDVTGGVITVYYSDESSEQVPMDPEEMQFEVTQKEKGSAVVTVSYLDLTAVFMITLTEPKLTKLVVKTPPRKTTYTDNDLFDPDGMVLIGTYDNGETKEIASFQDMQKPVHFGDAVFPAKVEGVSVPVFIKVEKRAVAKALVMKAIPAKTEYIVGARKIDLFGGAVALVDEDGNENSIDIASCSLHGFDGDKIGRQQVILTYQGMSCSFEISVRDKKLDQIQLSSLPVKRKYFSGQDYDLTGLTVEAIYDNGDKETITDYKVDKKTAAVGDTKVTISYKEKTAFFAVTVIEKVVESISLSKMPLKTEYMENRDFFSTAGGELLIVYNNKSTEILPLTSEMVSGFSNKSPGHYDLVVSYGGKETTLPITILAKQLIGMAISNQPYKTEYVAGECFDATGMKVLGIYSNGETKPIYDYQCDPPGPLKESDGGVMIFFMNCSTACKISVAPAPVILEEMRLEKQGEPDLQEVPIPVSAAGIDIPAFYPSSFGLRFDDE